MRFFLRLILIAGLTYLVGWQFPQWPVWPVPVVAWLVGVLMAQSQKRSVFRRRKSPKAYAFVAGFLGSGLVWGLQAWQANGINGGHLSGMMADLILQDAGRGWMLVLITGVIGALLGGFGAMTGNLFGEALRS